jgi:amino acid transporter
MPVKDRTHKKTINRNLHKLYRFYWKAAILFAVVLLSLLLAALLSIFQINAITSMLMILVFLVFFLPISINLVIRNKANTLKLPFSLPLQKMILCRDLSIGITLLALFLTGISYGKVYPAQTFGEYFISSKGLFGSIVALIVTGLLQCVLQPVAIARRNK